MVANIHCVDYDFNSNPEKTEATITDQSDNNYNEEQDTGKNPVYRSAEETMTFLLDALNSKDAQAIKDKFSSYAKENISDFDAKIDRFVDEFPGCDGDYTKDQ